MTGKDLARTFYQEIEEINDAFNGELEKWNHNHIRNDSTNLNMPEIEEKKSNDTADPAKNNNLNKIKLLILGEAPLSSSQYFYKNPGGFLSILAKHYGVSKNNLIKTLGNKGILVLDIYKFPVPTVFYDEDKKNVLYDDCYIEEKINYLTTAGLLDNNTWSVFRYQKLINRNLYKHKALHKLNFIKVNKTHCPLGIGANSNTLNPLVVPFLPK